MQNVTFNPYDEVIKTFVKQEQTKHVVGLLKSTLIMQSIFVVSCAFVFRDIVSETILICWVMAQFSVFLLRILSNYWYFSVKKHTTIETSNGFVTYFLCICNSLLWGASAFVLDFQQYPDESILLITINLGIGVGSTGIGGYWLRYFVIYTIPYICLFFTAFLYGVPNQNATLAALFVFFALSAKNSNTPVSNSMKPTSIILPPKNDSISSFKRTPTKAAGIIEITIFKENRNSSLILN